MKEELIVRIICGSDVGTAFYVAPDTLLTAYHTVVSFKEDGNNIIKDGDCGDLKFVIKNVFEDIDLAVLTIEGRQSTEYLPLLSHRVRIGEEFVSYGYPDTTKDEGFRVKGKITQRINNSTGDYKLRTSDVDEYFDYQGMSGAPIFQGDDVIGIVIEQDGGCLNIVSIKKLAETLKDETIVIERETSLTDLPNSIVENIENAHPN